MPGSCPGRSTGLHAPTLVAALALAVSLALVAQTMGPAPALGQEAVAVTFTYVPEPGEEVRSVSLRGSFNNWGETPMQRLPDGSFSVTLYLPPGSYQYKYFINGAWPRDMATARNGRPVDPEADGYAPDGFGGQNAVRVVTPGEGARLAQGDGRIVAEALHFDPTEPTSLSLADDPSSPGTLLYSVRLQAAPRDVERAILLVRSTGESWQEIPMRRSDLRLADVFTATVVASGERLEVCFRLEDGPSTLYLGASGVASASAEVTPFTLVSSSVRGLPLIPWTQGAVAYQVFPDRFANGDPSNDPPGTTPWAGPLGPDTSAQYYGGDLRGIIDRLPYLHELGVTLLYLNPIFAAQSSHRYDTVDYLRIDPHLGTLADFHELLSQAHALGIRVILDGVFNHTGTRFWAFDDVVRHGPASRYVNWYFFHGFPVDTRRGNYEGWWGLASLPKLNIANPEVRRHVLQVAEYWTRQGIDGWRLDVPNEIQVPGFWEEFRRVVKAVRPDAYLVGEIWQVDPSWLAGDRFDALMNYPLGRDVLVSFFARKPGWTARRFMEALQEVLLAYSDNATRMNFNVVGSHDTSRVLTELGGGDLGAEPSEEAVRRLQALVGVQFTLPGVPVIYYGDERGMLGDKRDRWDAQRAPVDWNYRHEGIYTTYRQLIALRKQHPALWTATVEPLLVEDRDDGPVVAYRRRDDRAADEVVVVTTPASRRLTVDIPGLPAGARYRDALRPAQLYTAAAGLLRVTLDGPDTLILVRQPDSSGGE